MHTLGAASQQHAVYMCPNWAYAPLEHYHAQQAHWLLYVEHDGMAIPSLLLISSGGLQPQEA